MFVLNMWKRKEQEAEQLFNNHRMTWYSTFKLWIKSKQSLNQNKSDYQKNEWEKSGAMTR